MSSLLSSSLSTRILPVGLLCFSFLAGCASTGEPEGYEELRLALWEQRFRDSVQIADALREESPGGDSFRELYDVAYLGYFLEQGRIATFADRDEEALDWFKMASEVDPESEHVIAWTEKTRNKLALYWLSYGGSCFTVQDYAGASDAYSRCLDYDSNNEDAKEGLREVIRVMDYRTELGEGYYSHGVRSLAEYQLRVARHEFMATSKYLPEMQRAKSRGADTDVLIAQQRVQVAEDFESGELYTAAHREFLAALVLDSSNKLAQEGRDRLAKEAKALQLLRKARFSIYRGRFDAAPEMPDEGQKLTTAQLEIFEETRAGILEARLEREYQVALNLELDGRYTEAIKLYDKLIQDNDYFKDSMARRTTLSGYVEMAAGYYKQAAEEKDPLLKLEHLRSIEGFWPDYRDVGELIERLERKNN